MIYEVYITETLCRTEQIEANNEAEAIAAIKASYDAEEIILDYSNFVEVDFRAEIYKEDPQD